MMVYQNCSTIKESLSHSSQIFLAKVRLLQYLNSKLSSLSLQYLNSKLSSLSQYESHLLTSTVLIYIQRPLKLNLHLSPKVQTRKEKSPLCKVLQQYE